MERYVNWLIDAGIHGLYRTEARVNSCASLGKTSRRRASLAEVKWSRAHLGRSSEANTRDFKRWQSFMSIDVDVISLVPLYYTKYRTKVL